MDEVVKRRCMPLRTAKGQAFQGARECDGGCLVFELSRAVLVPGARGWDEVSCRAKYAFVGLGTALRVLLLMVRRCRMLLQVLNIRENSRMMQLFLFLLDRCIKISAKVVLETLVQHTSYVEVHKSEMNEDVEWIGFRLWIPMTTASSESLLAAMENALIESAVTDTFFRGNPKGKDADTRPELKRRRVEEAARPLYARSINSASELEELMQLYTMSRSCQAGMFESDEGEGDVAEGGDEFWGVSGAAAAWSAMSKHMDALGYQRYFTSLGFEASVMQNNLYEDQRSMSSYFEEDAAGGPPRFNPRPRVRRLMREIECGRNGFLRDSSHELFRYLLPIYEPKQDEMVRTMERALAAAGRRVNLRGLSREALERLAKEQGIDVFVDPHAYSPVMLTAADMSDKTRMGTIFQRVLSDFYYIVTTLHAKNAARFRWAPALPLPRRRSPPPRAPGSSRAGLLRCPRGPRWPSARSRGRWGRRGQPLSQRRRWFP